MGVKSVKATIKGQDVVLTYNNSSGYWEATANAPAQTSWKETDHKYNVVLTAEDDAGNKTSVDRTDAAHGSALTLRVKETIAPTITVTAPSSGAFITSATPTLTWKITEGENESGVDSATIGVSIDGSAAVYPFAGASVPSSTADGVITYGLSYKVPMALSEGSHTITFTASDNDGNTATVEAVNFKVDTVPPTLNITAPAADAWLGSMSIMLTGTTNDATSSPVTVTVSINGGVAQAITVDADGSFTETLTGREGDNTIVVTATDTAGQRTEVTRNFKVDTKAPTIEEITITPNPVTVGTTYTIRVKVFDT